MSQEYIELEESRGKYRVGDNLLCFTNADLIPGYSVGTVYPITWIANKYGCDKIYTTSDDGATYYIPAEEVHEHFILLPDNYTDKDIFIEYLKHGITV